MDRDILELADERDKLREANIALVQALDRIHDVLSGNEYMENSDIGIHEIINNAIKLHKLT